MTESMGTPAGSWTKEQRIGRGFIGRGEQVVVKTRLSSECLEGLRMDSLTGVWQSMEKQVAAEVVDPSDLSAVVRISGRVTREARPVEDGVMLLTVTLMCPYPPGRGRFPAVVLGEDGREVSIMLEGDTPPPVIVPWYKPGGRTRVELVGYEAATGRWRYEPAAS